MIRAGESTGWWGATYFWFYKLLTFDAQVIYVISLVGLLALFHAIRFFVYSLPINVRFQKRVLLVVISTPLFGVFGVTVSHDVFQSAGVILLVSLALRIRREAITDSQVMFTLFLAGLYLTSTQIGLIIFFVFSIPLVLKKKYWVFVLAV
jgi:hypothetical protein